MKIIDSKYRPMLIKAFEIALAERAAQAAALDEPEMARYTLMLGAQDRQLLARLKKPSPFTVNGDGDALAISGALTAPLVPLDATPRPFGGRVQGGRYRRALRLRHG
jgi:hypothetical protein